MPSPDTTRVELFLDHLTHSGSIISTYRPLDLDYGFTLSEAGDMSCALALSQTNILGYPITQDEFAPKRTDYMLKLSIDGGGTFTNLQGGFCGPVTLKANEGLASFAGQDWLIWLDQVYPFGGYAKQNPNDWIIPDDVVIYWVNADQETIIADIIAGSYDALNPDESLEINPVFSGTGWGNVLNYYFELGDTTTMLDHVKEIGHQNDPYGFDFYMQPNKTLQLFSPRRVIDATITPIATVNPDGDAWIDLPGWTNNGPIATFTVGVPPMFPAFKDTSTHQPSRAAYRKWINLAPLGDTVRSQATSNRLTGSIGTIQRFPQKQISIVVRPEYMVPNDPAAFFKNQCGRSIAVDSQDKFLPYHRINANYWITSQRLSFDKKGNPTCTLTLDQIYSLSGL